MPSKKRIAVSWLCFLLVHIALFCLVNHAFDTRPLTYEEPVYRYAVLLMVLLSSAMVWDASFRQRKLLQQIPDAILRRKLESPQQMLYIMVCILNSTVLYLMFQHNTRLDLLVHILVHNADITTANHMAKYRYGADGKNT